MRCRRLPWRMVYGEGVRLGVKAGKQPSPRYPWQRTPLLGAVSCKRCTRDSKQIEQLNERVLERAGERPTAGLLMTHPGVGPITALATDVFLGDPKRFRDG